MSERKCGETYRLFKICLNSYDFGEAKGTLFHPGLGEEGFAFRSLTQLLIRMDDIMDEVNFPQSFTARRTFAPLPQAQEENLDAALRHGEAATFVVRILFRQHASWQGSVSWIEGHNEETFRSVLELIMLMDSAMGAGRLATQPGENIPEDTRL